MHKPLPWRAVYRLQTYDSNVRIADGYLFLIKRQAQDRYLWVVLASMAEWSKAVDLRPTIIRCEGSNPSSRISYIHIYLLFDDIYFKYFCLPCLPCLPTALSTDGLLKHIRFIVKNIQIYFVY